MGKLINLLQTIVFIVLAAAAAVSAQSTEFTYQGRLQTGSIAATGSHDFEFLLFDATAAGSQIGTTIGLDAVNVSNGIFSVRLDFGAAFPGPERFIEIRIRQSGGGPFETLAPRQRITSSPYAVRSLNADNADSATTAATANVANVATTAGNVTGIIQIANGGTGSTTQNFVDLTNAQTIAGNKTFSSTLSGNIVNAQTQFNINGVRVISATGTNVFIGVNAGTGNTSEGANTFVGNNAGFSNTTGIRNSFYGRNAGVSNGNSNNSFFGAEAGEANTSGFSNSFFGDRAGLLSTTGDNNSFFGKDAGVSNSLGNNNSFVGMSAGDNNTTGSGNSFFGNNAGSDNVTGSFNTAVGDGAGFFQRTDLTFATAIGAGTQVLASNTVVLGRSVDTVRVRGLLQVDTLGPAGGTSLCLNTLELISTCTAGNVVEKTAELELRIEAQAKEIEALKAEILANRKLQADLDGLKKFICEGNPTVEVCKQ